MVGSPPLCGVRDGGVVNTQAYASTRERALNSVSYRRLLSPVQTSQDLSDHTFALVTFSL